MPTRRYFLGAAAVGALPLALMPAAPPLLAQDGPVPLPRLRDEVLRQLAREMGRLHRTSKAPLPRGEHYRGTAATLRVLAALDLDDSIGPGLARLVASRGRAWVMGMPLDRSEVLSHLNAIGASVAPDELRIGLDPQPVRAGVLDAMLAPGYDFSKTLQALAGVLDAAAGDDFGLEDVAPRFRTSNFDDCISSRQYLIYLQFGLVVLCASGNAAGCVATAARIALIQHLLFLAGCP
jgi:hypothetical protein